MKKNLTNKETRTCIITREKKNKNELLRVVKTKENKIYIDYNYEIKGRGAYISKDKIVIEKAIKKKKIEQALRVRNLPNKIIDELLLFK